MNKFKIQNFEISKDNPPFIIAEAGINHNGDIKRALEMIKVAKNSGVTAIKFQTFKASEFIFDSSLTYTYKSQGKTITEPQLDLFERCELSHDDYFRIKKKCDEEKELRKKEHLLCKKNVRNRFLMFPERSETARIHFGMFLFL